MSMYWTVWNNGSCKTLRNAHRVHTGTEEGLAGIVGRGADVVFDPDYGGKQRAAHLSIKIAM